MGNASPSRFSMTVSGQKYPMDVYPAPRVTRPGKYRLRDPNIGLLHPLFEKCECYGTELSDPLSADVIASHR